MKTVQATAAKRKITDMLMVPRRTSRLPSKTLMLQAAPEQSSRRFRPLQILLFLCSFLYLGGELNRAQADTPEQHKQFEQAYADFKLGNYATALESFEILAEKGNVAAQFNLGFMRARGLGAPVDLVAAYVWFSLMARAGQERGQRALNEITPTMSAKQIAEGERRVHDRENKL